MASGTEKCQYADDERYGIQLMVTDTPGLCDTHRSEDDVLREVAKSVAIAAPGPHVVLMVLRCDRRFTEEEYESYNTLKKLFGDEVCKHMIVLFAAADALADTPDEQRKILTKELKRCPPQLTQIMKDVDNRFLAVSNKGSREERDKHAMEAIRAMQNLVSQNGGRYFCSDLTEKVMQLKEPMIRERLDRKQSVTREEAERDTNIHIAQDADSMKFFSKLIEVIASKFRSVGTMAVSQCSLM